ncbi:MAG: DUF87 domain-containing protein [Bacteriovoracia bacterium]
MKAIPSPLELHFPDTLDQSEQIRAKEELADSLSGFRPGQSGVFEFTQTLQGMSAKQIVCSGEFPMCRKTDFSTLVNNYASPSDYAYSLVRLPVHTHPMWTLWMYAKCAQTFKLIVSIKGVDQATAKKQIEVARRSNSASTDPISNVDSEISFQEATHVLEGLSRGDERITEITVVIVSSERLDLDPEYFHQEKTLTSKTLALISALGIRKRSHRSHLVRLTTAADLIPNLVDANEGGTALLRSTRGNSLYFSPTDPRLEALHWLVIGASGSGKSFFTGLILKRLIESGEKISVLFVDHNRSFRRVITNLGFPYYEPNTLGDFEKQIGQLPTTWSNVKTFSGIELSDLDLSEKKLAIHLLLSRVETYLRTRNTLHPFYLVLDECWNFMRDEPVLVQRAFREFRKLNGAVIAITQSLGDFLSDTSGQSICQNAPVRVLLRQGEDLSKYQGVLSLNEREFALASRLKQRKGEFSESLIKTPFLSRYGRLYPTREEYDLFRTDNIREELIHLRKDVRKCAV